MKTKFLFIPLVASTLTSCYVDIPVDTQGHPQATSVPNMGYPADNRHDTGHGRFIEADQRYGRGYPNGQPYQNPADRYVTPYKTYGDAATSRVSGFMPGSWEEMQYRRAHGWTP